MSGTPALLAELDDLHFAREGLRAEVAERGADDAHAAKPARARPSGRRRRARRSLVYGSPQRSVPTPRSWMSIVLTDQVEILFWDLAHWLRIRDPSPQWWKQCRCVR